MSSNKRTFSEISSNDSTLLAHVPPSKRKKLSNKTDKSINSMFLNCKDHNEFISYFNKIENGELTQILNIPMNINREIAEFTTGKIEQCANSKCNRGICILYQNWLDFTNKKESNFAYCPRKKYFFCEICKPFTAHFNCCDTIQCILQNEKCAGSWTENDKSSMMCYDDIWDDTYYMKYKCLYCDDDIAGICSDCDKWSCDFHYDLLQCHQFIHHACCHIMGVCDECNKPFCSGCDGFGVGFCDQCNKQFCDKCNNILICHKCDELICVDCSDNIGGIWCEMGGGVWFCGVCKNEEGGWCEMCDKFGCNGCRMNETCSKCEQYVCYGCNDDIKYCVECEMGLCSDCSVLCEICQEICCKDCYIEIEEEQYTAFDCGNCNNFIPKGHENCELDKFDGFGDLCLEKCEMEKCDNYVCLNCKNPKLQCTECTKCGDIDAMYLCHQHEWNSNDWKCNDCCFFGDQ